MKIKDVHAFAIRLPEPEVPVSASSRPSWSDSAEVANPMSRYPKYKAHRSMWTPKSPQIACIVTAEDGTWGMGLSTQGSPVISIINEHLGPMIIGENCHSTEKIWDMMFRLTSPYSSAGMASFAISAIDLALWDLKGKLLDKPVYELLGGPARDKITCYATGNDVDWYVELGFKAVKLACPYGPADGLDGLIKNEEFVAKARETIGPHVDLMLDCWMAFDVEYGVRLAERLRPYNLRWIEDSLIPEDFDGFALMRQRLPWQTLATGEHWYTPLPFLSAAGKRVVDIFQPDTLWVGGVTAVVKICHIAEAAGISVIPHGGTNYPYGQHLCYAMPSIPLGERSGGFTTGVPLEKAVRRLPGMKLPENGFLVPNDAPGFGIEMTREQAEGLAI